MTLDGRSFNEFLIFFSGMYPLVGWKVGSDLTYLAESASNDTGTIVNWAVQCGKFKITQRNKNLLNQFL
jgi:hypothetical protein